MLVLLALVSFYARSSIMTSIWGLLSLMARQTNIFWTGIYPAGLQILERESSSNEKLDLQARATLLDVARLSWDKSLLYDPEIEQAHIHGIFGQKFPR